MARPKSESPKQCIVKVRMTEEEQAELEKFSEEYGYSVSDTIRYALDHFYEVEPIRKKIAEVSPIGYCHRLQRMADEQKRD